LFPLPLTATGLLSSYCKHKNDCHDVFCTDLLFFISITMNFALSWEIF
jgi:hypothetical protein